ncbi:hypothetical protein UFOVP405_3 [uncultured Caudovirales phage]|uniref:Uncharacterized protein n=1 Tax=uncultured Caudovirales phage TaxID=2100421 RepID=A0A6J5M1Q2_9CAUD|nr:hypothetical protein UFOVP405_3 [uncultured Caudovirales phage]
MRKENLILIYYAAIAIASFAMMIKVLGIPEPRKLHCGIAEISPDFSTEDRLRCREERIKQSYRKHNL